MPYSYVYILASKKNGTLYIGSCADLIKRVYEHKQGFVTFTRKYKVHKLVYFEQFEDITHAIKRELQMKAWRRDWKIKLIEDNNPKWDDLYDSLL